MEGFYVNYLLTAPYSGEGWEVSHVTYEGPEAQGHPAG